MVILWGNTLYSYLILYTQKIQMHHKFNYKVKTIKLLEKNIEESFHDLRVGKK